MNDQERIQILSSHKNKSHHTLAPVLLQIINTSELIEQWQQLMDCDAAPRWT